ncbi:hypothetical protein CCY99_05820 [Helicobacter sp. 16-1353]|uniref:hypothetical protein n=1 Tax=Helicobacter sp. 16-1353 TaxID=2004996 RepID=UPI000DCE2445|nr:hypothetical protein [Helicobacter sp. 16-1353]RAX53896.1 hypothetical protein CCY99_05820 [Helicobacter sp. 16-1353]
MIVLIFFIFLIIGVAIGFISGSVTKYQINQNIRRLIHTLSLVLMIIISFIWSINHGVWGFAVFVELIFAYFIGIGIAGGEDAIS